MGTGNVEGLTVVSIDESSTISKTASQIFPPFPSSLKNLLDNELVDPHLLTSTILKILNISLIHVALE